MSRPPITARPQSKLFAAQINAALDHIEDNAGGGGSAAWDDVTGKPSTFTPSSHSHVIADVTGLQTALDGIPDFITVVKAADEERINSTAYTADQHLVSPTLTANSVYRFELMLVMTGDTAQDLRFRMERTGLADATLIYTGDLDGASAATATWNTNQNNNLNGAAVRMSNFIGYLATGEETGTIRVAWGQQVAGTPTAVTTMKANSMMMLRRVG